MQFVHELQVHQRGAVYADKSLGVESALQLLDGVIDRVVLGGSGSPGELVISKEVSDAGYVDQLEALASARGDAVQEFRRSLQVGREPRQQFIYIRWCRAAAHNALHLVQRAIELPRLD